MKRRAITFKHINGAQKDIPGVANKTDLAPRLVQETEQVIGGQTRTVLRLDPNFVAKVYLFEEDTGTKLTEKEKTFSQAVQDAILSRRAEQATLAIQANDVIRERLHSLEQDGEIEVLDWEIEIDDAEKQGPKFTELSEIALADFADRGIEIPAHMKKMTTRPAVAEKAGVIVKGSLPKEKKSDE